MSNSTADAMASGGLRRFPASAAWGIRDGSATAAAQARSRAVGTRDRLATRRTLSGR